MKTWVELRIRIGSRRWAPGHLGSTRGRAGRKEGLEFIGVQSPQTKEWGAKFSWGGGTWGAKSPLGGDLCSHRSKQQGAGVPGGRERKVMNGKGLLRPRPREERVPATPTQNEDALGRPGTPATRRGLGTGIGKTELVWQGGVGKGECRGDGIYWGSKSPLGVETPIYQS
jgi:hypothetical protein